MQRLYSKKWTIDDWKTFLEKDLVQLYRRAFILNELYNFLWNKGICGKFLKKVLKMIHLEDKISYKKI